ncbi:MAG: ISL3 family transposase [Mariprofundaceae bacterium]|nr:ISL3 family transposase [Mariprofundaceae bacterium]
MRDDGIHIHCRRDKRFGMRGGSSGQRGVLHRWLRRVIEDIPLFGLRTLVHIEYAQTFINRGRVEVERLPFVAPGSRVTDRYARLISGLCRYMPVSAVALYVGLRWNTVKNIDKAWMEKTLPMKHPSDLVDLEYIGVDEVARAKGHDYVTVVYDLGTGDLLWVHEGRTAAVLGQFLAALTEETANGIKAVAMDMGLAYQCAVKRWLPNADIVFDRFHVMQIYNKALAAVRRSQFRMADADGREMLKGSRYLLLRNRCNLKEEQQPTLNALLAANEALNKAYILKEQLQALWDRSVSFEQMGANLGAWCELADESGLAPIKRVAGTLRRHADGICNYAKHPITNARVEAGNVAIGLIRKRARGIRDIRYFILKIFQISTPPDAGALLSADPREWLITA